MPNSPGVFMAFKAVLGVRRQYFIKKYGLAPTFKCAIHGGVVTKAAVGRQGTHLAYHGDVLNTTSRILGLCHLNQTDLLMSEYIYKLMSESGVLMGLERVDEVPINGKTEAVTLYMPMRQKPENRERTLFLKQK